VLKGIPVLLLLLEICEEGGKLKELFSKKEPELGRF